MDDVFVAEPEDSLLSLSELAERRLTWRFGEAWKRANKAGTPTWPQMKEHAPADDWNWAFIVDVVRSNGYPHLTYLGQHLAQFSDLHLDGKGASPMSVLDVAMVDISTVLDTAEPVSRESRLRLDTGKEIMFRAMLAPLSEHGDTITHVIGAATGRVCDR